MWIKMAESTEPLSNNTAENDVGTVFESAGEIMKDALFGELMTSVESGGVVLTLLEDSREGHVLQEVADLLQDVRVLVLTQDVCRVLMCRRLLTAAMSHDVSTGGGHSTHVTSEQPSQSQSLSDLPPRENLRSALFNEIVQAVIENECSLIMTSASRSAATLEKVVGALGGVRFICISPDKLLVNKMEDSTNNAGAVIEGRSRMTLRRPMSKERTCHICKKRFSKRSGLLTHQKAFHEKCLPHKCELCPRAFVYPKELRLHKISVHTGHRPYHCEVCGKGFMSRKDLERHEPVHTGVRAFACVVCTAAFAHKANLDRHVRSKHKGQRPYVCSLCVDKKYCDRGGLRKHLASVHRIIDLPRKRPAIQSQNPERSSDADLTNLPGSDPSGTARNHDEIVTEHHTDDSDERETPAIVDSPSASLSTVSHCPEDAAISDFTAIESASKILQQLSQSVAASLLSDRLSGADIATPLLPDGVCGDFPPSQSDAAGLPSGNTWVHPGPTADTSAPPPGPSCNTSDQNRGPGDEPLLHAGSMSNQSPGKLDVLERPPPSGGTVMPEEFGAVMVSATDKDATAESLVNVALVAPDEAPSEGDGLWKCNS